MKATGIVRRIDDLGRVVIPKEIRRTLRIREGDPLEIFVDRDGEVILKKYSPIGELGDFAREFAESLHDALGHIALIADRDVIIAAAGAPRKEFVDKRLGEVSMAALTAKETVIINDPLDGPKPVPGTLLAADDDDSRFTSYLTAPIITRNEAIGAVILCSRQRDVTMSELDRKAAETTAAFLSRQME